MKNILIIAIVIFIATSCQKEKPPPQSTSQNLKTISQIRPNYDSLEVLISDYQNKIMSEPDNKILMRKLLSISFDSTSGCFLVAGKGVFNKKLPESAQNEGRKIAANKSAQRWAFYLKAWHQGQMIPFGAPVSGTITYSSEMLEKDENDTLFVLLQIPLGSISRN